MRRIIIMIPRQYVVKLDKDIDDLNDVVKDGHFTQAENASVDYRNDLYDPNIDDVYFSQYSVQEIGTPPPPLHLNTEENSRKNEKKGLSTTQKMLLGTGAVVGTAIIFRKNIMNGQLPSVRQFRAPSLSMKNFGKTYVGAALLINSSKICDGISYVGNKCVNSITNKIDELTSHEPEERQGNRQYLKSKL